MEELTTVYWNTMVQDICKKFNISVEELKEIKSVQDMERKINTMSVLCDFVNKRSYLENCDGNDWED